MGVCAWQNDGILAFPNTCMGVVLNLVCLFVFSMVAIPLTSGFACCVVQGNDARVSQQRAEVLEKENEVLRQKLAEVQGQVPQVRAAFICSVLCS